MPVNVVFKDGSRFNPARDLANCTPYLIEQAFRSLGDHRNTTFAPFMQMEGADADNIRAAAEAIGRFTTYCLQSQNIREAVEKSGLNEIPKVAQVLVMAAMGKMLMCSFWTAIRDVTAVGEVPLMNQEEIAKATADMAWLFDLDPLERERVIEERNQRRALLRGY